MSSATVRMSLVDRAVEEVLVSMQTYTATRVSFAGSAASGGYSWSISGSGVQGGAILPAGVPTGWTASGLAFDLTESSVAAGEPAPRPVTHATCQPLVCLAAR